MQAIVCTAWDSPDKLKVTEVADPLPGPDEVLVDVKAAGLGYVDALMVAGKYQIRPQLPFIPGGEISGVINRTGDDVKHLRTGQRIIALPKQSGLAEKNCLKESECIVIPDTFSYQSAAGALINYCTAYHAFTDCTRLSNADTVLVLGGSGGVGIAGIDMASAMGAHVIAAASTNAKRSACIEAGASHAIDYTVSNWREALARALDGRPLTVVYDPVGGDFSEPALRSLAPDGRFLVVGFASGGISEMPLNLVLLKRCSIVGVNWGGYIAENPGESRVMLNAIIELVSNAKLAPQAGQQFALKDAGTAMMKMLNRESIGKVVISMDRSK
jgi:NADPH:quinone reductase